MQGEVRKFVEQSLAQEKPVFVVIMIGMNDRHSMQACGPSGKTDGVKSATYAFRSKEWAEAYGKEVASSHRLRIRTNKLPGARSRVELIG